MFIRLKLLSEHMCGEIPSDVTAAEFGQTVFFCLEHNLIPQLSEPINIFQQNVEMFLFTVNCFYLSQANVL